MRSFKLYSCLIFVVQTRQNKIFHKSRKLFGTYFMGFIDLVESFTTHLKVRSKPRVLLTTRDSSQSVCIAVENH